jgi:hypothetical protein
MEKSRVLANEIKWEEMLNVGEILDWKLVVDLATKEGEYSSQWILNYNYLYICIYLYYSQPITMIMYICELPQGFDTPSRIWFDVVYVTRIHRSYTRAKWAAYIEN